MDKIVQFLQALFEHWEPLVFSGVVGALVEIVERRWKREVKWKTFARIMFIGLLISCYLAWGSEHDEVAKTKQEKDALQKQIEDRKPKLWFKIQQVDVGDDPKNLPGATILTFFGDLYNSGGTPSIVQDWVLKARLAGESQFRFANPLGSNVMKTLTLRGQYTYTIDWQKTFLPGIVATEPVGIGAAKIGIATFVPPNIRREDVQKPGTYFELTIWDVIGVPTHNTYTLTSIGVPPQFIPGMPGVSRVQSPKRQAPTKPQ